LYSCGATNHYFRRWSNMGSSYRLVQHRCGMSCGSSATARLLVYWRSIVYLLSTNPT